MFQRVFAALPVTRIREQGLAIAFVCVSLIAMAGWVYFITVSLSRMIAWVLN